MSALLLIIGLILFVGLVIVHEFGHFLAARRSGVEVEEFAIGFPPRIWKKRLKSGMLLTLNWLPLGGFVKLKGENDSARSPGSFGAASTPNKIKIMLAGVLMNLVTAFVLLSALALLGMPRLFENQFTVASDTKIIKNDVLVGFIEPGSPAELAGLQPRDRLEAIGSPSNANADCTEPNCIFVPVKNAADIRSGVQKVLQTGEQTARLTISRQGQPLELLVSPRSSVEVDLSEQAGEPKGHLGVIPTEYVVRRSTWSAPITAAGIIGQFTKLTLQGLGSALAGLFSGNGAKAAEQVSGPVGIFVVLKDGTLLGYEFILMIIAVISLTLAIMNVLPIPALDGGRLFVLLLYRLLRRPLTKQREDLIHGSGFALLMVLFVVITIVDIRRFF